MNVKKSKLNLMRVLTAVAPLTGTLSFPIVVLLFITRSSINTGIGVALLLSIIWFISMLTTSEMPHEGNSHH